MTNVLIIVDKIDRPYATGIDMYYSMMLKWLPKLAPDLNFKVISFGESTHQFPPEIPNLSHHSLPLTRRQIIMTNAIPLLGNPLAVWSNKADLVHLMMPLPLRLSHPRMVATIYDLTPVFLPNLYPWYARLMFHYTLRRLKAMKTQFATISHQTGHDLVQHFHVDQESVHPIPIGVNESFQPPQSPAQIEAIRQRYTLPKRYLLYIGSMHKRKNLATILEAFVHFKSEDSSDMRLVIAGRMELGGNDLLQQVSTHGLSDDVILPGYIPATDLPMVIAGAEALLYPSLYEGFGLPALEAMMCGTVVIASIGGSIPEIVGKHAYLCSPLDVQCFAEQMHIVAQKPYPLSQATAAREWAEQFSWETTASKTIALYQDMLS